MIFLDHGEDAIIHFLETTPPVKRDTPKINGSFAGMFLNESNP